MSTGALFKGIAVVIDDQLGDSKSEIGKIVSQIRKKNIPFVQYTELPDLTAVESFEGISFMLLDWNLDGADIEEEITQGVVVPGAVKGHAEEENIAFLKKMQEVNFAPVFIFTNEKIDKIMEKLKAANLYQDNKPNNIFIKNKTDLLDGKLFKEIEKWLEGSPSVYVLKEWEAEYRKAKNSLFREFYDMSSTWPRILWDNFSEDKVDESLELGEIITRNLHTRMAPFSFKQANISPPGTPSNINKSELIKVLEGERFIVRKEQGPVSTGDVFKKDEIVNNETVTFYYINLRAQCDLVRDNNPYLYCLRGRELPLTKINSKDADGISFSQGQFNEKINHAIVPFIGGGKIIDFKFSRLFSLRWNSEKTFRIGCLLPPYITRIQQRYGLYQHRQGLPRTPDLALFDPPAPIIPVPTPPAAGPQGIARAAVEKAAHPRKKYTVKAAAKKKR